MSRIVGVLFLFICALASANDFYHVASVTLKRKVDMTRSVTIDGRQFQEKVAGVMFPEGGNGSFRIDRDFSTLAEAKQFAGNNYCNREYRGVVGFSSDSKLVSRNRNDLTDSVLDGVSQFRLGNTSFRANQLHLYVLFENSDPVINRARGFQERHPDPFVNCP